MSAPKILSPAMLKTYKQCKKKYFLRYVKNIIMPSFSTPFEKGKKIHAIAGYSLSGIDISKFSLKKNKSIRSQWGCSDKDVIGVYVARFDYGKNQDKLVKIWRSLGDLKSVKLWLIGDGPTYPNVTNMISQMGLSKNVICFGQSNDVPLILSNADFALFPSSFEGFSIALIEKCASGLPVIASDIPPFKEIINSGGEGFLVNLNDEKGWLEAIKYLATDVSVRTKMGEMAVLRAKNFSISITGEQYFDLYSRILNH